MVVPEVEGFEMPQPTNCDHDSWIPLELVTKTCVGRSAQGFNKSKGGVTAKPARPCKSTHILCKLRLDFLHELHSHVKGLVAKRRASLEYPQINYVAR